MLPWPKEVFIVSDKNIQTGTFGYVSRSGTPHCCLIGLRNNYFPCSPAEPCTFMGMNESYQMRRKVEEAIMWAIRKLAAHQIKRERPRNLDIIRFNDRYARQWFGGKNRKVIARAWNLGMAKLGYVVNNPEARTLKRLMKR